MTLWPLTCIMHHLYMYNNYGIIRTFMWDLFSGKSWVCQFHLTFLPPCIVKGKFWDSWPKFSWRLDAIHITKLTLTKHQRKLLKHWPQPAKITQWSHAFFIHHQIPGEGALLLWCWVYDANTNRLPTDNICTLLDWTARLSKSVLLACRHAMVEAHQSIWLICHSQFSKRLP